jgi:hypothetical protein
MTKTIASGIFADVPDDISEVLAEPADKRYVKKKQYHFKGCNQYCIEQEQYVKIRKNCTRFIHAGVPECLNRIEKESLDFRDNDIQHC